MGGGLDATFGPGRCRPNRRHAWWLWQVQHPTDGKLLLHPGAPSVGELLPVALDPPPGCGERPEPRPHVLRHDQAEGISSALPAEAHRGRARHNPLEVQRRASVATQSTKVQGLQVGGADSEHRALPAIVQVQCRGVGLQRHHDQHHARDTLCNSAGEAAGLLLED